MKFSTALLFVTGLSVAGCATATTDDESPEAALDGLDAQQTVTWAATGMSIAANMPGTNAMSVNGSFVLSGSGTTKAGVCLVNVYLEQLFVPHTCTTTADCTNAPWYLPPDGARYCLAENGGGSAKVCTYRPGSQASWCAGSPALSGNPAIGAGTYTTPWHMQDQGTMIYDQMGGSTSWFSVACFAGCTGVGGAPTTYSVSPMREIIENYKY